MAECIPKAQCRPLSLGCFSVGDEFTAYLKFDPDLENLGFLGKRGVEILVRKDLNPSEISFAGSFQEALWINIKLKNKDKLLLGVVYRSPSGEGQLSTEALCALLETVHASRPSHLVIVGDFNYKEIDWSLCVVASRRDVLGRRDSRSRACNRICPGRPGPRSARAAAGGQCGAGDGR